MTLFNSQPSQGGRVSIQSLLEETRKACEIPNSEQPFACLDLSFISALLTRGYGLKGGNEVMIFGRLVVYLFLLVSLFISFYIVCYPIYVL